MDQEIERKIITYVYAHGKRGHSGGGDWYLKKEILLALSGEVWKGDLNQGL